VRKILTFALIFYLLALLQTSFLVHFNIFLGSFWGPGLILILVILLNFLERPRENSGVMIGFFAGFFLDIFAENPFQFFGFYTLISLTLAICIKFILSKYFRISLWRNI